MPSITINPNDARTVEGDNVQDTDSLLNYREGYNDNHSTHFGAQFTIPSTVDPELIGEVELRFYVQAPGSLTNFNMPLKIPRYEVTTLGTGTNQPLAIYNAAAGSTVSTNTQAVSAGWTDWIELHAADLIAAIESNPDHSTTGTEVAIVNHAPASGNYNCVIYGDPISGAAYPPELRITDIVQADVTIELDSFVIDPKVDALSYDWDISCTSVSALGTADGANIYRNIDIHIPKGAAPTNGWPCIMYIHGGGWDVGGKEFSGNENGLNRAWAEYMMEQGYAIVSVEYRLMDGEVFYWDIQYSWPQPVHDVRAAMEWLNGHADDYNIDLTRFVMWGHSAGAQLAMFAGLSACREDMNAYTGDQNPNGDRPAGYGRTDNASPWLFDFNEAGELSSDLKPKGIISVDGPLDNYGWYTGMPEPEKTVVRAVRKMLYGVIQGDAMPDGSSDELDLDHYIDGGGTTSFTSAMDSVDIPPLMLIGTTAEDVVNLESSMDNVETALDSVGYDTSTAAGVLNTSGGLTKHIFTDNHAQLINGRYPWAEEIAWLEEVIPEPAADPPETDELYSGFDTSTASITTTTLSPASDSILIVSAVETRATPGAILDDAVISGVSGSWTKLVSNEYGYRRRHTVWVGTGGQTSGTITVSTGDSRVAQELGIQVIECVNVTGAPYGLESSYMAGVTSGLDFSLSETLDNDSDLILFLAAFESSLASPVYDADWGGAAANVSLLSGGGNVRMMLVAQNIIGETQRGDIFGQSSSFSGVLVALPQIPLNPSDPGYPIFIGGSQIDAVRVGASSVERIYIGGTEIWTAT